MSANWALHVLVTELEGSKAMGTDLATKGVEMY